LINASTEPEIVIDAQCDHCGCHAVFAAVAPPRQRERPVSAVLRMRHRADERRVLRDQRDQQRVVIA
jgi:hypothetical protein